MSSPESYQSSVSSGRQMLSFPVRNVEERLKRLSLRSGYPVVQRNGQRLYGPPPDWTGKEPPKGCEVFIGKLPREIIEDDIVPVFEKIGPLYLFRLMMDFSGTNRGYAFATYTNRKDAKEAIRRLNGYEIRPHRQIGVVLSVDNCRLYLGRIPKTKTRSEVQQEISSLTEGVVDVILYPDADNKTMNRGFAFVEYCSHQAATAARRKLLPKHLIWGTEIEVDWAEPELELDDDVISKVKNLYVRNLSPLTDEERLKDLFESITGPKSVVHVKKQKDYAFVHFFDRKDAVEALQKANGLEVDGSVIEVVWAKPVDKTHQKLKNEQMAAAGSHPDCGGSVLSLVPSLTASVGSAALLAPAPFTAVTPPYPLFLAATATNPTMLAAVPPTAHHPRHLPTGALLPHQHHSSAAAAAVMTLAGSANAVPYAGVPFIDPTAGNISQNTSPKSRSAAGMRSAGYSSVSSGNQRRLLRRKVELDTMIVKQQGSAKSQLQNLSLLTNGDGYPSVGYANAAATTGHHMYFLPPNQQIPFAAAQHLTMIQSAAPVTYCQTPSTPNHKPPLDPSSTSSPPNVVSKPESFTKILERYCSTMGFSQPEYQQYETTVKNELNQDQPSFVFRVTIPQLVLKYGDFNNHSPAPTVEEAKQKAALFVLLQLGHQFGKVNDFSESHQSVYPHIFPTAGYIPCLVPEISTFYTPFTTSAQHLQAAQYFDTSFQRQNETITEQQGTTLPVS